MNLYFEVEKESKNSITLHITDSTTETIIPAYAFIVTKNKIHDKMVLQKVKSIQGTGYDDDLDEITAVYKYRNNLSNFKDYIEQLFTIFSNK